MAGTRTLFDKAWDAHVVSELGGDMALLHADRILLHDLSGLRALRMLKELGHAVRDPSLCFAAPDHTVSSDPALGGKGKFHETCVVPLAELTAADKIRHYAMGEQGFGILHVIGPELGITLPGASVICGDSHTCTHGGIGALAWGVGTTELVHAMATQTVMHRKPQRMRISFNGELPAWLSAKDMILHVIGAQGAGAGNGYALEYAGSAVRAMSVEGRMTICNLSIEMAAKVGMVGPDDQVFEYLNGREYAPKDEAWDLAAISIWKPKATPVQLAPRNPLQGESLCIAGYGRGAYREQRGRCTEYLSPGAGYPKELVELQAPARQGDSGGPILDTEGRLAGVLFGEGDGRTIGSCVSRLRIFLASVGSDGFQPPAHLVAQKTTPQQMQNQSPRPLEQTPQPARVTQQEVRVYPAAASATGQPIQQAGQVFYQPVSQQPFTAWSLIGDLHISDAVWSQVNVFTNTKTVLTALGGLSLMLFGLRLIWRSRQQAS